MSFMEQSATTFRPALMTAISGKTIAGVGSIVEDSSSSLRVEMSFADEPGQLALGDLFRVESGDEVIVTELRAYRLKEQGACLLLGALHRASARGLEKLAQQYNCEFQAVTRRTPVLGTGIEGVISRLRMSFEAPHGKPSEASRAFLFMREMVAPTAAENDF